MNFLSWFIIEIAFAIAGVVFYIFYPNNIIAYFILAIVVISAVMSIKSEFRGNSGVEING